MILCGAQLLYTAESDVYSPGLPRLVATLIDKKMQGYLYQKLLEHNRIQPYTYSKVCIDSDP